MAKLVDKGGFGEGDGADFGMVHAGDVEVDLAGGGWIEQGGGVPVAEDVGGFKAVAYEFGAPVVGVVVLAAVGVLEKQTVLGDLVADAGGEPPPEAGTASRPDRTL
ncbi:hypothetical protein AB0942_28895 [Streptomyces nodosus]|uniref:hypothetical protein n=1 Tax=Streptomyces nodosus TaxID=40318 RepID=UPI003456F496